MAEDANEKVDWVIPVSSGAVIDKTPISNLHKAAKQYNIQVENIRKNDKGEVVADINKVVVEGMPAPKK